MLPDYPLMRIKESLTGLDALVVSCPPEALHWRAPRHSLAMVATHVAISITHWTARLYHPQEMEDEDAIYRRQLGISGWDDNFNDETEVIGRFAAPEITAIAGKAGAYLHEHFTGQTLDEQGERTLLHILHHTAYHVGEAATIRRLASARS